MALSTKYELPFWETWGFSSEGAALLRRWTPHDGIELMEKTSVAIDAMGMVCYSAVSHDTVSRGLRLRRVCQTKEFRCVCEATDLVAVTQERWSKRKRIEFAGSCYGKSETRRRRRAVSNAASTLHSAKAQNFGNCAMR